MIAASISVVAGFVTWGLVEYVIHGVLSHRLRTPVAPLHAMHHHEPRAVFTAPLAWIPGFTLVFLVVNALLGPALAVGFVGGLGAGFARYEHQHWRIHFRWPRSERERRRRNHHLAHHFVDARAYGGVTTRLWDRVFGTLPAAWPAHYAAVEHRPPLEGRSNLRSIWNPRFALARLREARRRNA